MRQQQGDDDRETVVLSRIGDTVVLPKVVGETPRQPPHGTVPTRFDADRQRSGEDGETMFLPRLPPHGIGGRGPGGHDGNDDREAGDDAAGLPLPDIADRGEPRARVERSWRRSVLRYAWIGQLLLATAALLVDRRPTTAVLLAIIAVLPIVNTVVTIRGHHPDQWIRFRLALRRRTKRRRTRSGGALGPLNILVPRSRLIAVPGTGGRSLGVVFDRTGWVAVMAVTAPATGTDGTWLARLVAAAEPAAAATTVQILLQQRAARGGGPTGPQHQAWIVMRVDGADAGAPSNTAGVGVVLRTCVRRLTLTLAEAGLVATPLGADEVRGVLESTIQTSTTEPRIAAVESWQAWSCADRTHVSFEFSAWSVPLVGQVLRRTAAEAETITTVSLPPAAPDGSRTGPAWLRISHRDPRRVEATAAALHSSGVELHRANGRQLPAVLATVPLGRSTP